MAEEIAEAISEGGRLIECALPISVQASERGGLTIKCVRTEPQGKDASGRMGYGPVKGSEFEVEANTFIVGIGQSVAIPECRGPVRFNPEGISVTLYQSGKNGKYFAGGDMVAGPRRVCDAIASGKLAALSIHALLHRLDMGEIRGKVQIGQGTGVSMGEYLTGGDSPNPRIKEAVTPGEIKPEWFAPSEQKKPSKLSAEEAVKSFREVVADVDQVELLDSCNRCFSCGTCLLCDRCYLFCPEVAVIPPAEGAVQYQGNAEYCKGCGVCSSVCPRGVMTMSEDQ